MRRIGSLYSGIAGLELGVLAAFVEAGLPARIAWQCEIDPFCSRVLAHHFPDVQRFSDVATVHNPPNVDVLCGGFACQDVSAAGKGAGLGIETRSGFTLHHLLRIIDEILPPYLVIENVASGAKRWLPRVVQELRGRGYRPRAVPLGAVDVGAHHRRLRVFVVADRGSRGRGPRPGVEQHARSRQSDAGASGPLPDTDRVQLRDESGWSGGARGSGAREPGDDGTELGDAAEPRRAGTDGASGEGPAVQSERSGAPPAGDGRSPQPGMGLGAHGLPFDVAGHAWPAGRGDPQEAWEPPRALPKEVRHFDRPAKLRALGNAVVPQCGLVAGRILVEMMGAE